MGEPRQNKSYRPQAASEEPDNCYFVSVLQGTLSTLPTPPQPTTTGPVPILSPSTSRPDPEPDPSSSAVVRSGRGTGGPSSLPLVWPLSRSVSVRPSCSFPVFRTSRLSDPRGSIKRGASPILHPILRLPRPPYSGGPPTASGALGPTPGLAARAGVLVPRSAAITPARAAPRSVADATERHPKKEAPGTRTGGGGTGRGRLRMIGEVRR